MSIVTHKKTLILLFFIVITLVSIIIQSERLVSSQKIKDTIIFIPGLGLTASDYTYTINALENNGYSVISYSPTYSNPSDDEKMITIWTKEVGSLIGNRRVIVIGHSVGGAVAVHFCARDSRCIVGINLDGSPAYVEKLTVPFLYIQGDTGKYCTNECILGRTRMEEITRESGSTLLYLPGVKHFNFTDRRNTYLLEHDYIGSIDGRDLINKNIIDFLKKS